MAAIARRRLLTSMIRSVIVFSALMLAVAGLVASWMDKSPTTSAKPAQTTVGVAAQAPASNGRRSVTLSRDRRGHFQAEARVDGRRLNFMVDTGASVIALTADDARRLGIFPSFNDYTARVQTANGMVKAAPVTLGSVDIGGLVVRDVPALVMPDRALNENLLGMAYLGRLKRFEYAGGKLVLEN
jgi:aspartyl protease family protein